MPETNCGFEDIPQGATGAALLVAYGPTLLVDIGFDAAFKPLISPATAPIAGMKGIQALVDTGATESCLDSFLASQLNLPIVDKRIVAGVHGSL